jgi:hypothetical protein
MNTYYINEIITVQVEEVVPTGIFVGNDSYGVLRHWKYSNLVIKSIWN